MSTNAPNAATLVTTPSKIMSGRKSRISSTPSLNVAVVNAGRGSRPGFSSSFKISLMVGTPKRSSAYLAAFSVLISAVSPMTALMSFLMSLKIFSTSGYDSGCTAEASSGLSPPITRRKPAACSKVLSPSRGTAFRPAREVNAPFMSRYDTMACATDDGVQRARQLRLRHIVLVLADTYRFRVDLDQFGQRILQAARDRDGAAQRHVHVRQFARGELGGRIHRRARFGNDDLGHVLIRMLLDQVLRQLVRLARSGAVAD